VEWDAPEEYCFPTGAGPVVQGGLVTALLDSAMGGACWSVLDGDETFLTAVRRTRRVVFCAAELLDAEGTLLAAARCTQVVLPVNGSAGREQPLNREGQDIDD
jgi:acyl-coenzyme A thioesterase PaaI-like protein